MKNQLKNSLLEKESPISLEMSPLDNKSIQNQTPDKVIKIIDSSQNHIDQQINNIFNNLQYMCKESRIGIPLLGIISTLLLVIQYIYFKVLLESLSATQFFYISFVIAFIINYILLRQKQLNPYLQNQQHHFMLKIISGLTILWFALQAQAFQRNSHLAILLNSFLVPIVMIMQYTQGQKNQTFYVGITYPILSILLMLPFNLHQLIICIVPILLILYIINSIRKLSQSNPSIIYHMILIIIVIFLPVFFPLTVIRPMKFIQWCIAIINGGIIWFIGLVLIKTAQKNRLKNTIITVLIGPLIIFWWFNIQNKIGILWVIGLIFCSYKTIQEQIRNKY